jgi:hypothetical protein
MIAPLRAGVCALVAFSAFACAPRPEETYVRGHGLTLADLPIRDQVAIYQETIGGAFTVGDPALYLLLNPRFLPRTAGLAGGEPLGPALRDGLLDSRIVQGTCEPAVTTGALKVAHCRAPLAGYVVRFSPILRLTPDTMEVYLVVQRYSTPTSTGISRLEFERVYKLVKHRAGWDAVAEGRIETP